jgi:hypothetical protein
MISNFLWAVAKIFMGIAIGIKILGIICLAIFLILWFLL